MIYDESGLKKK